MSGRVFSSMLLVGRLHFQSEMDLKFCKIANIYVCQHSLQNSNIDNVPRICFTDIFSLQCQKNWRGNLTWNCLWKINILKILTSKKRVSANVPEMIEHPIWSKNVSHHGVKSNVKAPWKEKQRELEEWHSQRWRHSHTFKMIPFALNDWQRKGSFLPV